MANSSQLTSGYDKALFAALRLRLKAYLFDTSTTIQQYEDGPGNVIDLADVTALVAKLLVIEKSQFFAVGDLHMCRNGHPKTAENLYTCPQGRVSCRPCTADAGRRWRERNPEKWAQMQKGAADRARQRGIEKKHSALAQRQSAEHI
jgi:hypothetical protein